MALPRPPAHARRHARRHACPLDLVSSPRSLPHPRYTARPDGLAAVYRRRNLTATTLYPIVQHHLETFLADATGADPHGEGVPR